MQCVIDDDISEKYYNEGVVHFNLKFDIELTLFPANTPTTLSPELRFSDFKVPTQQRKLRQPLTPTEKACFSTHFELWKRCVKLNKPIMVFEHDARLNPKITEKYDLKLKYEVFCKKGQDYQRDGGIAIMGKPIATAYMIAPKFADRLVRWTYKYQKTRRHISDPNSKGINMQTDTFLNSVINGYKISQSEENKSMNQTHYRRRTVFLQSKDYGAIVDHGPLDK